MYIQVRTSDTKENCILNVSKLTTVEELRVKVSETLGVEPPLQRLLFGGKQLEDGYKVFDYNINLNDVVMLAFKDPDISQKSETNEDFTNPSCSAAVPESRYFKIGDVVATIDSDCGAWFEGKIVSISWDPSCPEECHTADDYDYFNLVDGLIYHVQLTDELVLSKLFDVRPVWTSKCQFEELKVGDVVLVNYNVAYPSERGEWYDFVVESTVENSDGERYLWGSIYIGKRRLPLHGVKILFCDDIFKIERPKQIICSNNTSEERTQKSIEPGFNTEDDSDNPVCEICKNNTEVVCRTCGCYVCGVKKEPEVQLMCDECDMPYHIYCLNPPLESVPNDEHWYCPECKNDENEIVRAGEKLKESKKKAKIASNQSSTNRDWGKGMACVGRTKECSIVPSNHYGPIPGVEVGTCWKFRVQVSEAGVHRPHVAGIHGRESDGAYSIVLSGGYEDDVDDGDLFVYTGSGGRDLSGNKRTAGQSSDQRLTRMNKALALNCNAELNSEGAKATNWREGKPIRVVRNYNARKHSKFAPEEGNRYDGIYKVVEYRPEKGKSGFIVWRYYLRRDDPIPAPWTREGKERMDSLGLTLLYPEGYLEAMSSKEEAVGESKKRKRVLQENKSPRNIKPVKVKKYLLEKDVEDFIRKDVQNAKLWSECEEYVNEGKQKFLSIVSQTFMCICCQELVFQPVTTECNHNFCSSCLKRAFKAEVYTCPCCRSELGQKFKFLVNEHLSQALLELFPGYGVGQ